MDLRNKKINFRKLIERQLNRAPVDRTARRNYLIALNSLVQEDLSTSLRVQIPKHNPKLQTQKTQYDSSFMSKTQHRPKTVNSNANISLNKTSYNFTQSKLLQRPHALSLYHKIQLREKELRIYKKRSQQFLSNPFYKIQHTRTKTEMVAPTPTKASVRSGPKEDIFEERPLTRLTLRPVKHYCVPSSLVQKDARPSERREEKNDTEIDQGPNEHVPRIRQRSETVKYQQIKDYFENKYCSK